MILVDVQPDSMPGGALACHQGDAIVPGIGRLLRRRRFAHVVATRNWPPAGHVSFAQAHAGKTPFEAIDLYGQPLTLWPAHCVQDSDGAALHPAIDWSALHVLIRKGSDPHVDSYSGFRENHGPQARARAPGWPAGCASVRWTRSTWATGARRLRAVDRAGRRRARFPGAGAVGTDPPGHAGQ